MLEELQKLEILNKEISVLISKFNVECPSKNFNEDELSKILELSKAQSNDKSEYRRIFLFCVLYIYNKATLFGKSLKKGSRKKIAKILQISDTGVSHLIKDIFFNYKYSNIFRNNCTNVLNSL